MVVGKPKKEVEEELTRLIGDYRQLQDRVEKTPICPYLPIINGVI